MTFRIYSQAMKDMMNVLLTFYIISVHAIDSQLSLLETVCNSSIYLLAAYAYLKIARFRERHDLGHLGH